jgi:DNA helicase-2/ATP-dependent DNA helicase PcrA
LDLEIEDNHRSTDNIIELLNEIRSDGMKQRGLRAVKGDVVRLFVGSIPKIMAHIQEILPDGEEPWVLTRRHEDAKLFRDPSAPSNDPWDQFQKIDPERARFVLSLVTALELARLQHFDLAVDGLARGIAKRSAVRKPLRSQAFERVIDRRALAITLLEHLLASYPTIAAGSSLETYRAARSVLETHIPGVILSKITTGKCADFCSNTSYATLAASVKCADETRRVRVIHQAKGAESSAVVVHLTEDQIHAIVGTKEIDPEEKRLIYVALSRARDHLFLVTDKIDNEPLRRIRDLAIKIEVLS